VNTRGTDTPLFSGGIVATKIEEYKLWVHVEAVDKFGDPICEPCEPRSLGTVRTEDRASEVINAVIDMIEAARNIYEETPM
jgi:hypothetical protein